MKFNQQPIDIIAYSQELRQHTNIKNQGLNVFSQYFENQIRCKQYLLDATTELENLNKLNQPKHEIPQRLNRFPFHYGKFLLSTLLRIHNYISGPQRTINHHFQAAIAQNINVSQQLIREQQRVTQIQKELSILQEQFIQLSEQMLEIKQNSVAILDEN